MPISNAEAQRRWRTRRNAYAAIARNELSGPAKTKHQRLERELLKASTGWVKHLNSLADWRGHFQRLKDCPPSTWRSEQQAEALEMMRHHESTAAAYDTLLRSTERELKSLEHCAESMTTAREILSRRRP
jgi:hypothetical protein